MVNSKNPGFKIFKIAIPIILVLVFFATYSGFARYFLIGVIFLLTVITLIGYSLSLSKIQEISIDKSHTTRNVLTEYEYLTQRLNSAIQHSAASQRYIEHIVFEIAIADLKERLHYTRDAVMHIIESGEIMDVIDNKKYAKILYNMFKNRFNMLGMDTQFEHNIRYILDTLESEQL